MRQELASAARIQYIVATACRFYLALGNLHAVMRDDRDAKNQDSQLRNMSMAKADTVAYRELKACILDG
jgi:hypothetical protein